MLPQSMAKLTGMIVCSIVVFGTDLDVAYAVPLGVLSGGLAIFFVSAAEAMETVRLNRRRAE
jgi:hypothetical protein